LLKRPIQNTEKNKRREIGSLSTLIQRRKKLLLKSKQMLMLKMLKLKVRRRKRRKRQIE